MNDLQSQLDSESQREVSLYDFLGFLADSWKKLVASSLIGVLLGLSVWVFITPYQSKISLRNSGLSILSIKSLQTTLPNLFAEIFEKGQAPDGMLYLYKSMSNPDFWKKAVTPEFTFTKSEIKDLGPEVLGPNNPILLITILGAGSSRQVAIQNADLIAHFFRQGSSFIAIREFFQAQQSNFLSSQAKIDSRINATLIDLEYQKNQLKNLEELAKRFPVESRTSQPIFDPKGSGAKYLPINTQIIAINTDINNNNQLLSRLKDQQAQQDQVKRWLEYSGPLIEKNYNGLELNKDLLALEVKFRDEINSADPKAYAFVDSLRSELLSIEARFRWGLEQDGITTAKKSGPLKSAIVGLASALVLMLMFLLAQRGWASIKGGSTK